MAKDFTLNKKMYFKTEISLNKTKILGLLFGAIVFMALGVLFINEPETFVSPIMRNPEIIRISGISSVVFFGLCFVVIARKLFDNKPGLIIDQYGITNNTNATDIGLIEWADIIEVEKKHVMSNKFLILYVKQPEKYIDRAKNLIVKQAIKMNNKTYGSPITIVSSSLKIDFDDLEMLINAELEKRKNYS